VIAFDLLHRLIDQFKLLLSHFFHLDITSPFPLPLSNVALRVAFFPPTPLSLSSGGLAGRSVRETGGRSPCIVSSLRVCGLGPVSGILPTSWCGALDLGAQILGAVWFLVVALVLLWPEQVAGRGGRRSF
jgi:hypothetical protein